MKPDFEMRCRVGAFFEINVKESMKNFVKNTIKNIVFLRIKTCLQQKRSSGPRHIASFRSWHASFSCIQCILAFIYQYINLWFSVSLRNSLTIVFPASSFSFWLKIYDIYHIICIVHYEFY